MTVFDVVIPARDEEQNIGRVLAAFAEYARTEASYPIGVIWVVVDDATSDETEEMARATPVDATVHVVRNEGVKGKGQCVSTVVNASNAEHILFCDADYIGLTPGHIRRIVYACMARGNSAMVVGIPAYPRGVPEHVTKSWPNVSGFRIVPVHVIREALPLHGYVMETQLNVTAAAMNLSVIRVSCHEMVSPFTWPLPSWRRYEMERDREWGINAGWLPPGKRRRYPAPSRRYPNANTI